MVVKFSQSLWKHRAEASCRDPTLTHKKRSVRHFPCSRSDVLEVKWTWECEVLHARFIAGIHTFLRFCLLATLGGDAVKFWQLGIISSSICIPPHVKVWRRFSSIVIANKNLKSENQSSESEKENSESGTKKFNSVIQNGFLEITMISLAHDDDSCQLF